MSWHLSRLPAPRRTTSLRSAKIIHSTQSAMSFRESELQNGSANQGVPTQAQPKKCMLCAPSDAFGTFNLTMAPATIQGERLTHNQPIEGRPRQAPLLVSGPHCKDLVTTMGRTTRLLTGRMFSICPRRIAWWCGCRVPQQLLLHVLFVAVSDAKCKVMQGSATMCP